MRNWILGAALFILLAIIVLLIVRAYDGIQRDLTKSATTGRAAVAALAASTLTHEFQRQLDVARSLAGRVRFSELVAQGKWQEASLIMKNVPREFAAIEEVALVDLQGSVRVAVPAEPGSKSFAWSAALQKLLLQSMQPGLSNLQDTPGRPTHFLVAAPIFDKVLTPVGFLALRIDTSRFKRLFVTLQPEQETALYVLDARGVTAYCSMADANEGQEMLDIAHTASVERARLGAADVVLDDLPLQNSRSNERFVTAFAPSQFGWSVLAQWPHKQVFAARDEALQRLLWAVGMLALVSAAAVALLIQLLTQHRQRALAQHANALLETRVHTRTEQLERANMELESFCYSISHDLRAPLRAIDGYTSLLTENGSGSLPPDAARFAGNIHRNVTHMSRLIDELLELARVGRAALEIRTVDMTALANEAWATLSTCHPPAKVEIASLPEARTDAAMIRQVLANLIDNALKYSSRSPNPTVNVGGRLTNTEQLYWVQDNGVGFDMKNYDQLFKPFSRLHANTEFPGTGVGLAIVKRIMDRLGGRIWAESKPNEGTTLYFALPPAERALAAKNTRPYRR